MVSIKRMAAAALACAALMVSGAPAQASAGKAAPDITCNAGYFRITNAYTPDPGSAGITAQGNGNFVVYTNPAGSCWRVLNQFVDSHGFTAQQYQNEGGSCLQFYVGTGYMGLEPCGVQGTPDQTFFGWSYTRGVGWIMRYEDPYNKDWDMGHMSCSIGNDVGADLQATCWPWNFPA